MKQLKFLAVIISLGLALTTNLTSAADNPESIKLALEQTIAKLEESLAAVSKGEDKQKIADLIVEARQSQKGISTSDSKVSVKRSQSNHKLVEARTTILDGDLKGGEALLKEALAGYKEVQEKFNATH
jgi:hypothetical protein